MEKEKYSLKLKTNEWLESPEFISRMTFDDKYYMSVLGRHIGTFLKISPVPFITSWDPVHKRIYFVIGKDKKYFPVDVNIHYKDFVTLVERWAFTYYPRYELDVETEEEYSDDEIYSLVEKGENLNDVINKKKIIKRKEIGILTAVYMNNDEFVMTINNKKYLRLAGKVDKPLPVSQFIRNLRDFTDSLEMKNYIFEHSTEVQILMDSKEDIFINYSGNQMLNFFFINYPDLKDFSVEVQGDGTFKWGKYVLSFDSLSLQQDCFSALKEFRRNEGNKVVDILS